MMTPIDIRNLSPARILKAGIEGWRNATRDSDLYVKLRKHEAEDSDLYVGAGGLIYRDYLHTKSVAEWNSWITGKPAEDRRWVDLYQISLSGLDLPEIDFEWVSLHKAKLFGLSAPKGNFRFANLVHAHAEGIQAPGADFRGAQMEWADFKPIYPYYSNNLDAFDRTSGLSLSVGQISDLKAADFRGANLRWVNFRSADLRRANFSGASIKNTAFDDADLTYAHFDRTQVEHHLEQLLPARVRIFGTRQEQNGDTPPTIAQILKAAEIDPTQERTAAVEFVSKLFARNLTWQRPVTTQMVR